LEGLATISASNSINECGCTAGALGLAGIALEGATGVILAGVYRLFGTTGAARTVGGAT